MLFGPQNFQRSTNFRESDSLSGVDKIIVDIAQIMITSVGSTFMAATHFVILSHKTQEKSMVTGLNSNALNPSQPRASSFNRTETPVSSSVASKYMVKKQRLLNWLQPGLLSLLLVLLLALLASLF
mgnify:CR=1 FL=1